MTIRLHLWRDSWRDNRVAYLVILTIVAVLSGYLYFGPKPWIAGVTAEVAAGGELLPKHYVVSGLWAAAWADIAIAIVVAVAGPWLFRRLPAGTCPPPVVGENRRGRVAFIVWLSAAAIVCGVIQAPRLSESLWGDEEYTAKRFVAGYYRRDAEGAMTLKMPEWQKTLWDFRRGPSNHQLFSALSRVSHSFHKPSDDPKAVYFSETLIRLPSFLASLGTVMAVGWLAALVGGSRAGVMAGFILAIHPWFIRYGPEARGYGLMMLMLTLSVIFLYKAAIGGRWRHWLAFGLVEFLCFISYLGSLHFILMLNFSGLLLVLFAQAQPAARWPQFGRFVVANAFAAAMVIFMLAPVIEPTRDWLARTSEAVAFGSPPDLAWVVDVLSEMATGLPWRSWDESNPLCIHLSAMSPLVTLPMLLLAAGLFSAGAVRLYRDARTKRYLLPVMLLPAPLMVIHAWLVESFLFPWYLLVALPVVAVLMALGIDVLSRVGRSEPQRRLIAVGGLAVFVGLMVLAAGKRVQQLRTLPVEPLYQSVALTREIINPADPAIDEGVITVGFSMWTEAYDPAAQYVRSPEELRAQLELARQQGKELYVNFGQFLLAQQNVPEIMAIIEDEDMFEPVAVLYGLWQPCTRWVYRAKLAK